MTRNRAAAVLALLVLTVSPFVGAAPPPPVEDPTGLAGPALAEAMAAAEAAVAQAEQQLLEAQAAAGQALATAEQLATEQVASAEQQLADAQAQAGQAAEDAQALAAQQVAAAEQQLADAQALAAQAVADAQQAADQQIAEALLALAQAQAELELLAVQTVCEGYRGAMAGSDLEVWTSCNMGLGSGLDADLLDGLSSEVFLARIDTEALARVTGDDALAARLDALDLDIDGRAWAAVLARDGAGSTLDADTLDGLHSARFVQYAPNGNVGIGTADPINDLHIQGPASSLMLEATDPEAATALNFWEAGGQRAFIQKMGASDVTYPGLRNVLMIGSDGRAVPGNPAGISFNIYKTWGNEREAMRIADTGNVGIGTSTPTEKLMVTGGNIHVLTNWPLSNGGPNDRGIYSNTYGASTWGDYGFDDGPVNHVANNLQFITESKQKLTEGERPVRMKISENGNVGVGTPSPGSKLDVRYDSGAGVRVGTTTSPIGSFDWTTGKALLYGLSGYGLGLGANNREHVTIDTAGKVGVGTSSPAAALHVKASPGQQHAYLEGTSPQENVDLGFRMDGTNRAYVQWHETTDKLRFFTGGGTAADIKMVVGQDGHVGIGTLAPQSTLEVAGNVRVSGAGNGVVFPDGTLQTTAARERERVLILEEGFDNGHLPSSLWTVSKVGNGAILFNNVPSTIRMDTSSTSGGDSVTLRSTKQFSVNEGTLIFKAMLDAYRDSTVYGDRQPRGLAAGTDRNNAIEFISASPTSVGCRTVAGGVATQTNADIGQSVYEVASYQIVAKPGFAKFYVNGALVCTHTTNVPTAALNLHFTTSDGGAGTTPIDLYSASFEIER